MDYREIEPHGALRSVVRCYWELRESARGPGPVERVVPDGCTEIVLNRADPFRRWEDERAREQDRTLLVGQLDRPLAIQASGHVDLFGVRFEPHGLHRLLGVPMHELTGVDVGLGQVDERLRRALEEACHRRLPHERVRAVEAALAARLAGRLHGGLVAQALALLGRPRSDVATTARRLRVGRRSLERAFRAEVGLSPKSFAGIRRVQSVLARLDEGGVRRSWAELALDHGFADQSHLIREFRRWVGTTPRRYQLERSAFAAGFEAGSS